MVFPAMPVADLLKCAGLSLAAGLVLAVVAAVGPAGMVARLAPMEAMRIE
jgi:ABC-type antimicrobial peptide transport system permease subunit